YWKMSRTECAMNKNQVSRRNLMTAALAGSALASAGAPKSTGKSASKATTKFWTNDYWAHKTGPSGDVKLYMFRKRASAPRAGEAPLPVLMLVHGSSMSSRSSFDLATPGKGEYSVMNV